MNRLAAGLGALLGIFSVSPVLGQGLDELGCYADLGSVQVPKGYDAQTIRNYLEAQQLSRCRERGIVPFQNGYLTGRAYHRQRGQGTPGLAPYLSPETTTVEQALAESERYMQYSRHIDDRLREYWKRNKRP